MTVVAKLRMASTVAKLRIAGTLEQGATRWR
jgi:hypothetical protein